MPFFLHLVGQSFTAVVIEPTEKQPIPIKLRHLHTEAVKDTGELDTDVTAADNDHLARQSRKKEYLVRGDGMLGSGQLSEPRANHRRR